MIKSLSIKNGFTHKNKTFVFEPGLTLITGPNESGKTLIIEMIRYALFGTKALRGDATDYKGLIIDLSFTLNGIEYAIHRGVNCSLSVVKDNKEVQIVSGIKSVNPAIIKLFGYDLKVFDVANNSNQGEVERLGSMKPTERKKMVEQVVGLSALDDLLVWINDRALEAEKMWQGIEQNLVRPETPLKPADYQPSSKLRPLKEKARKDVAERDRLVGVLTERMSKPEKPVCEILTSLEILKQLVHSRKEVSDNLDSLMSKRKGMELSKYSEDEISKFEASVQEYNRWLDKKKAYGNLLQPTVSLEEIRNVRQQHSDWNLWKEKKKLLDLGTHKCPGCGLESPIAGEALAKLNGIEETGQPAISLAQCDTLETYVLKWQAIDHDRYKSVTEVSQPQFLESDITRFRVALQQEPEVRRMDQMIQTMSATLNNMPDYSDDLAKRTDYEIRNKAFEKSAKEYQEYLIRRKTNETRYKELAGSNERLEKYAQALESSLKYETSLELYTSMKQAYDSGIDEVEKLRFRGNEFRKSSQALKVLKNRIKAKLLPSLNKTASALLAQMTGGQRTSIQVNEDFEVQVDGQKLHTLSGSGKSVANLSVRIALGRVLTHKVFNVFMADEADAQMDNNRAENTIDCFRLLSKDVSQIILVSHKKLEADHYINL